MAFTNGTPRDVEANGHYFGPRHAPRSKCHRFMEFFKTYLVFPIIVLAVIGLLVIRWEYTLTSSTVNHQALALVKAEPFNKEVIDSIKSETVSEAKVGVTDLLLATLAVIIALFGFAYLLFRSDADNIRSEIAAIRDILYSQVPRQNGHNTQPFQPQPNGQSSNQNQQVPPPSGSGTSQANDPNIPSTSQIGRGGVTFSAVTGDVKVG